MAVMNTVSMQACLSWRQGVWRQVCCGCHGHNEYAGMPVMETITMK